MCLQTAAKNYEKIAEKNKQFCCIYHFLILIFTTKLHKLNINAENLSDPYLRGRYVREGSTSGNLTDLKLFYRLINDGIEVVTQEPYGANTAEDYKGLTWANDSDDVLLLLTVIRKPIPFTSALLTGTTTHGDLTEAGQRDLVDYAIQIANEVTRDTEGYKFVSSQVQKDLL